MDGSATAVSTVSGSLLAVRWDVPVLLVMGLLALVYGLAVRRVVGRGGSWPPMTTMCFGAGLAAVVVITCGTLGVRQEVDFGALALQDVLLVTVVPVLLALGRPLRLRQLARAAPPRAPRRAAVTRILSRVLGFPLTGSVLAAALLVLLYTTGWDAARLEHPLLLELTRAVLLGGGCLFVWPLLGVDAASGHTSNPTRVLVAMLDGLLDAIPGLAVLGTGGVIAAGHYAAVGLAPSVARDNQHWGGTAMIAVAELVDLPALLVLLVLWVRSDEREARALDLRLDATAPVLPEEVTSGRQPATTRPWWETEPGPLAGRYPREGSHPPQR